MSSEPIQNTPRSGRQDFMLDPAAVHQSLDQGDKRARAEKVAAQLEGVFMEMMMKSMRATVPEDGLFGASSASRNYIEMLDQQYAQLQGIPRDPRFHEVLVNQIMKTPNAAGEAMQRMREGGAATPAASLQDVQRKMLE